jgi:hypothetical protein
VAETTHTHIPAPIATHQPAPVVRTHHVAQPIFQDVPVHAQVPVTGVVAKHATVHQPIVHETRTHTVQSAVHAVAAPVAAVAAAPAYATVSAAAPAAVAYAGHAAFAAAPAYAAGYAAAAPGYALPAGLVHHA